MAERKMKDEEIQVEEKKATRKKASTQESTAAQTKKTAVKAEAKTTASEEEKTPKKTEGETAVKKTVRKTAVKKPEDPEAKAKEKEAAAKSAPPKKKNIIGVFRPQNSQTGMVKPGSRPRPDGSSGPRPAGSRPAGTRPAGTRPAGTRPAGTRPAGTRPAGTRPAVTRPAGTRPAGAKPAEAKPTAAKTEQKEEGAATIKQEAAKKPVEAKSELKTSKEEAAKTAAVKPKTSESAGTSAGSETKSVGRPVESKPAQTKERKTTASSSRGQGAKRPASDRRESSPRSSGGERTRSQEGRGGRGNAYSKVQPDAKPHEKEGRKRQERGDRNRDRGDKLDRLEKNARNNQRNNLRNNPRNTAKGGPRKGQGSKPAASKPAAKKEDTIRTITLPEKMTVGELADSLKVTPSALIKKLLLQGTMMTVNEEIDFDKAEEIALEYNCICEKEEKVDVIAELLKEEEDPAETLQSRPPVVCVMGHVDHGKTSLLDAIRDTHVIDKEAGGITQHIGAYMVSINGRKITFLDTPGHEAFTAMRMRGANSTDIAILVVAADDGVMPQTVEAINHAKAAGIEIIVAINKIDKPSANVERVKQELSEYELVPEDWGGTTIMVPVSAHTHEGIDDLLEMILLTADVLELQANPNRKARGLVIEAQLDKGKGPVATVLVQKGTLHVGDPVAAGSCYGKIRAMMDENGHRVNEAGPSTPVEILGLSDVPEAGDTFVCLESEKEARSFAETFYSEGRQKMIEDTKLHMSLDDLYEQIQAGSLKELDLIIKADVQGSVEALKQSLLKLSNDEVVLKVIHSGVGSINESDVVLASASNAIIIGFNVSPDAVARETAERENVDIRTYSVIYDAIGDVESAMKGMLDPIYEEKVIGHAQIRQLFKASNVGMIAGSYVTDGMIQRNSQVRITRDDEQIFEGPLASLKRFKDDVKEVKAGYECGLVFEKFNDIKVDDVVEAYVMEEVPR